jgi:hypothetical protein
MKLVKNFVFSVLLVSAIAFNAVAGDVDTPGKPAVAPPNSPPPVVKTDNRPTPVLPVETSDYLFFEALVALLSVY